jgi:hypothetical protein
MLDYRDDRAGTRDSSMPSLNCCSCYRAGKYLDVNVGGAKHLRKLKAQYDPSNLFNRCVGCLAR